jgi:ABC-type phosphate/phosphonate transport system substrate-binding protein
VSAVAGLTMYDPPELRDAVDAWWVGIARWFRHAGIADVPDRLTRGLAQHDLWGHRELMLAQTCGYPLTHGFAGRLAYLATPRYDAPGCDGTAYCSFVVAAADLPARSLEDLRGRRVVLSGWDSHSGHNVLRRTFAPLARGGRFFASVAETGSHAASIDWLGTGRADVAAIDCVTFALLCDVRPAATARVRVVARTQAAPGLPYVTRADAPADRIADMRAALARAIADPDLARVRRALRLVGFEVLADDAYASIVAMEQEAAALGYPALA